MKVLVTGSKGQLGSDLIKIFATHHDVMGVDKEDLDITNLAQAKTVINSIQPGIIIHCAAYTAVDKAETDEDRAYQVNTFGTRNLAIAAAAVGAKVCYISTDYVFDGTATAPYKEYDNTNPMGVYGKSKRAGEQLIQSLSSRYFIVRTSWLYGIHGQNFVKTMLNLGKEKKSLKVVCDQMGSPTYTRDLARFLSQLIVTEKYGIYHASNTGICSWYEFAKAIFEESGLAVSVEPCTTEEYPRPAPRPKYSVMDHLAIRANGFEDLRPWRDALRECLQDLKY